MAAWRSTSQWRRRTPTTPSGLWDTDEFPDEFHETTTRARFHLTQVGASESISFATKALNAANSNGYRFFDIMEKLNRDLYRGIQKEIDDAATLSDGSASSQYGTPGRIFQGVPAALKNSGTYGSIPRANNDFWHAQTKDVNGPFSIDDLDQLIADCSAGDEYEEPDLIVMPYGLRRKYQGLFSGQRRLNDGFRNDQNPARNENFYGGIPIKWSKKLDYSDPAGGTAPQGDIWVLNCKWWVAAIHRMDNMRFHGWREREQSQVEVGRVTCMSQLMCENPRYQGILTDVQ